MVKLIVQMEVMSGNVHHPHVPLLSSNVQLQVVVYFHHGDVTVNGTVLTVRTKWVATIQPVVMITSSVPMGDV
jgi:hypothetical protein